MLNDPELSSVIDPTKLSLVQLAIQEQQIEKSREAERQNQNAQAETEQEKTQTKKEFEAGIRDSVTELLKDSLNEHPNGDGFEAIIASQITDLQKAIGLTEEDLKPDPENPKKLDDLLAEKARQAQIPELQAQVEMLQQFRQLKLYLSVPKVREKIQADMMAGDFSLSFTYIETLKPLWRADTEAKAEAGDEEAKTQLAHHDGVYGREIREERIQRLTDTSITDTGDLQRMMDTYVENGVDEPLETEIAGLKVTINNPNEYVFYIPRDVAGGTPEMVTIGDTSPPNIARVNQRVMANTSTVPGLENVFGSPVLGVEREWFTREYMKSHNLHALAEGVQIARPDSPELRKIKRNTMILAGAGGQFSNPHTAEENFRRLLDIDPGDNFQRLSPKQQTWLDGYLRLIDGKVALGADMKGDESTTYDTLVEWGIEMGVPSLQEYYNEDLDQQLEDDWPPGN